jgi:purine-nucleoside phosphorylase
MTTWEEKFIRYAVERWVFQGSDPHSFTPRLMILSYGEDFLSPMLKNHKHFGAVYSGYIGDKHVGYMRVPPGTVILEGVMRSLAFTRVDTVIGLGTCGALQQEIECGDVVIAQSSKAGECLSMHYGFKYDDVIPADGSLTEPMTRFFSRNGLTVHAGPIVTTGAVFRETDELVSSWSRDGYLGVELEASGQFALAEYMGFKTTMALLVTDHPLRKELAEILRTKARDKFIHGFMDFISSPSSP